MENSLYVCGKWFLLNFFPTVLSSLLVAHITHQGGVQAGKYIDSDAFHHWLGAGDHPGQQGQTGRALSFGGFASLGLVSLFLNAQLFVCLFVCFFVGTNFLSNCLFVFVWGILMNRYRR